MLCEHLTPLEHELHAAVIQETFRGQAWSSNCHEWVYFACFLDRPTIRARMQLAECVKEHEHRGTHDGQEAGFVCAACNDAIMGVHPSEAGKVVVFR
jgi:hypothetical protein